MKLTFKLLSIAAYCGFGFILAINGINAASGDKIGLFWTLLALVAVVDFTSQVRGHMDAKETDKKND